MKMAVWAKFGGLWCSGPTSLVAAAFGRWLGFVLMIAALFVIFALGLVTILMASKGVEYVIIWSA
jgi:hypothetical protein